MPRILLIDSYDSFTLNLAEQIRRSIPYSTVHVIHNDELSKAQLIAVLPYFDAVTVGPGPGSPATAKDVGVVPELWSLPPSNLLPVFGVCLGHQSLCLHFGGKLKRLASVVHGQKTTISHIASDIFSGVKTADVVRYHSLHVALSEEAGDIIPLAWSPDEGVDGRVLMAARHRSKPFWGVQYHPESICTEGGGDQVFANFWCLAEQWNAKNGRSPSTFGELPANWRPSAVGDVPLSQRNLPLNPSTPHPSTIVRTAVVPYKNPISVPSICEILGALGPGREGDVILLDSTAKPSRYSILGIVFPSTPRIVYHTGDSFLSVSDQSVALGQRDIWEWLAQYMAERKAEDGLSESPFWGGFMGYSTYEAGVETLDITPSSPRDNIRRPDVNFAFIERSVIIDHATSAFYIQSIGANDAEEDAWINATRSLLVLSDDPSFTPTPSPPAPAPISLESSPTLSSVKLPMANATPAIIMPRKDQYLAKIQRAQDYLAQGESYELCVTATTRVVFPSWSPKQSAWSLFKTLRERNPAPYSAYLRLGGTTLVGSSPERFLSWSRDGLCELRPIKGTVKKHCGDGVPNVTFKQAEEMLLGSPKEIAENLMIVDLIRHDLARVAIPGTVSVPKLFVVEEYECVFQLVSVIRGQVDQSTGWTGWDALARSLPPGSMTGAPKKRSVQLLQSIEDDAPRGVYSGVCGYWSVCGAGDFSVIIRSAFRYDSDGNHDQDEETWYLGAGGAITALSDPNDEWEEMRTKLGSGLKAFFGTDVLA